MPVVFVGPEPCHAWLHPPLDSAAARDLLAPPSPEEMVVRTASPVVDSARHENRTAWSARGGAAAAAIRTARRDAARLRRMTEWQLQMGRLGAQA
jgi:hypothetical protein